MGMDDSGPIEIVPGTPERRIIDYKYANGVLVQSFQGQLNPKFQEIPAGFDPATRFMWEILFVGDRGWIVAGRQGPLKASNPAILADVMLTPAEPLQARREDRCHLAAGPGRADLSGARLRAPRQLDSGDSAPLAAGVECGGRDAIDKRRAPREHRHLDGPHAEMGSGQGRIHRRRHGQSHAPEGDAGALDDLAGQPDIRE